MSITITISITIDFSRYYLNKFVLDRY